MIVEVIQTVFLGALVYACSSFVFDLVHWGLHSAQKSSFSLLRRAGALHQAHHEFWNARLRFNSEWESRDLRHHLIPEFFTGAATSALFFFWLPWQPVALSLGLMSVLMIGRVAKRGRDSNHQEVAGLRRPGNALFVGLNYHALHHIYPDSCFGSLINLFDRLIGTATPLRGRRYLISGASGAFGQPMKALLEKAGATEVQILKHGEDFSAGNYERARSKMGEVDVLVLCHGSKEKEAFEANATSFVNLVELFRNSPYSGVAPREVWAVGSEIECHPAFGAKKYYESKRAFARVARWYYQQDSFVYRHIVPSSFRSPMGPGLISGETAAKIALFHIRRGFRYTPVTYSGIAWLNYLKFLFRLRVRTPNAFLSAQAVH